MAWFTQRPHGVRFGARRVYLPELVTTEKKVRGEVRAVTEISMVDQSKELPDPKLFSLEHLISAGVPAERVSTVMLRGNNFVEHEGDLLSLGEEKEVSQSQQQQQQQQQQQTTNKGE